MLSAPDWVANDLPLNYQFGSGLSVRSSLCVHVYTHLHPPYFGCKEALYEAKLSQAPPVLAAPGFRAKRPKKQTQREPVRNQRTWTRVTQGTRTPAPGALRLHPLLGNRWLPRCRVIRESKYRRLCTHKCPPPTHQADQKLASVRCRKPRSSQGLDPITVRLNTAPQRVQQIEAPR